MSHTIIIGAGVSGLALGKHLSERHESLLILEKESKPGGNASCGHQRLYSREAASLLQTQLPELKWREVTETAVQINKKGEFGPLSDDFSAPEDHYLHQPFLEPELGYGQVIGGLYSALQPNCELKATVTHVDIDKRTVTLLDGSERSFSKLLWTGSFANLLKICGGTPEGMPKKGASPIETGGLTWDIEVRAPLFPHRNTVVFPFRYKDLKLRALGNRGAELDSGAECCHWTLFLEDSLLENREELAKIVRAFKRELGKQFPQLEELLIREKLAFHPSLAGNLPVPMPSLEVFEGIVCLGSDIRAIPQEDSPALAGLRNLDRSLANCLDFLEVVLPEWLDKPAVQGQISYESPLTV